METQNEVIMEVEESRRRQQGNTRDEETDWKWTNGL